MAREIPRVSAVVESTSSSAMVMICALYFRNRFR